MFHGGHNHLLLVCWLLFVLQEVDVLGGLLGEVDGPDLLAEVDLVDVGHYLLDGEHQQLVADFVQFGGLPNLVRIHNEEVVHLE